MSPDSTDRRPNRRALSLSLLLVLAAGLRLYKLEGQSLWGDEVLSIRRAQRILQEGLASGLFDGHGPLFFYSLLPFVSLSVSEWVVRLPSVLFGVALVLVVYFLGREFLDRDAALLAAAIAALSPFSVYYSQEVRYIILFILLCALSLLFMYRYFESGSSGLLVTYLVLTLLALFSFVGGVFVLLGQNLWFVLARPRRPRLVRWLLCQTVIAVLFVPWLVKAFQLDINPFRASGPESVSIGSLKAGHLRPLQPIHLAYTLYTFSVGFSLGPSNQELHEEPSLSTVRASAATAVPAALVFGALLLAGIRRSFSLEARRASLLMLCFLVPLLSAFMVSTISRIPLNPRYSAAAFPPFVLFLAAGVGWWWRRGRVGALVVLCGAGLTALSLAQGYYDPRYAREDSRGAAAVIAGHRGAGEPLIVGAPVHAFAFYYPEPFTSWKRARLEPPSPDGEAPHETVTGKVWVAATRTWEDPRFGRFLLDLQGCFRQEDRFDLAGYQVLSFSPHEAGAAGPCRLRTGP